MTLGLRSFSWGGGVGSRGKRKHARPYEIAAIGEARGVAVSATFEGEDLGLALSLAPTGGVVPPTGLEPVLLASEASALSTELRGREPSVARREAGGEMREAGSETRDAGRRG